MLRSKKCVFLSHCLLAQTVRANGLAKYFPAAVKPVVQFCLDNDINMMQMPCPEVNCSAGGFGRDPHGKQWYEQHGLRETCARIAMEQIAYAASLLEAGNQILAFIGLEFSPACAVAYLNRGPVVYKGEGIFVEELKKEMEKRGLRIPFVGVNQRWLKKLDRQLGELLDHSQTSISGAEAHG